MFAHTVVWNQSVMCRVIQTLDKLTSNTLTWRGAFSRLDVVRSASKRSSELFAVRWAMVWIASVVVVIASAAYDWWGRWGYLVYCSACAAPLVLRPLLLPAACDAKVPWYERHAVKANLWQGIFGFVGNYWYTHYFYRVLKADYTFEAHRLNDVPISMFCMTHAYFMFYHVLSNAAIRFVRTRYERGLGRLALEMTLVQGMSYLTAVMEAVTIAAFPYYDFEDRYSALVYGSAFYGIYFLASFPMFFRMDEWSVAAEFSGSGAAQWRYTLKYAAVDAAACAMLVLCALDFVRLLLGVELFAPH